MNLDTGKPNHIEDWLVEQKVGQWFGWSDASNKVYANLVIHDGSTKPTEAECNDGLKAMVDAFDAREYSRKRRKEYPSVVDQLDDIYHNGIDAWKATIKATKDKYPKS